jgi:hypothetical protein
MANAYGDYLREKYPELKEAKAGEEVPINVELVGAINKKVVKFGMPIDSVVATTTFQQAQNPIFSACNTHAKLVLGKATRFASIRFELYILAPDSVVGLIEPYASIQYYV